MEASIEASFAASTEEPVPVPVVTDAAEGAFSWHAALAADDLVHVLAHDAF